MPSPQSLMSVATDSSIRIYERLRIIKGDDKKISSPEEAKAILAIPSSDILWTDNKDELPLAQIEARNYLKFGDKNLWDVFSQAGKYIKTKGNAVLDRISNYLSSENGKPIAKN